ncbi:MAG: DivIVA domain-containing protein, partial [Pleurocapsa sp.]
LDESQAVTNPSSNSNANFNIEVELDNLKELILNSSRIPLTELAIVDEDLFLNQLLHIQENLPIELATAIEIVNRRQEIIADAQGYACLIVKSAEEKAHQIVQESAIIRQAELDGARIRLNTEQDCEQLRQNAIAQSEAIQMDADKYADKVLADLENRLQGMITIVQNGRCQLDQ